MARSTSAGDGGEEADAPIRRHDLREARDVDRALQLVECGQPRRLGRGQPGIGVVLDDGQVVRLGQLQQLMRRGQRQHGASRVVQYRDGDVNAWLGRAVGRLEPLAQHRQIGPGRAAWHRGQLDSHLRQPREFDGPTRFIDQHRVTGDEQQARDDVQRLRRAGGRDDLLRRGGDAQLAQAQRQSHTQPRVAGRFAIAQAGRVARIVGQRAPHCGVQQGQVEPVGRQRADAGRWGLAVPMLEHAAHQCGHVARRGAARHRRARQREFRRGRTAAHEEAPLLAGLDQALCLQQVIGRDHRARRQSVAARGVPHRWQPCAGGHRAGSDAIGMERRQLFSQRCQHIALQRRQGFGGGRRVGKEVHLYLYWFDQPYRAWHEA